MDRRLFLGASVSSACVWLSPTSALSQETSGRFQVFAGARTLDEPGLVLRAPGEGGAAHPIGRVDVRTQVRREPATGGGLLRLDRLAFLLGASPARAERVRQLQSRPISVQVRAPAAQIQRATNISRQDRSLERALNDVLSIDDVLGTFRHFFVRETGRAREIEARVAEEDIALEELDALMDSLGGGTAVVRRDGSIRISRRLPDGRVMFFTVDEVRLRSLGIGPGSATFDLEPTHAQVDIA